MDIPILLLGWDMPIRDREPRDGVSRIPGQSLENFQGSLKPWVRFPYRLCSVVPTCLSPDVADAPACPIRRCSITSVRTEALRSGLTVLLLKPILSFQTQGQPFLLNTYCILITCRGIEVSSEPGFQVLTSQNPSPLRACLPHFSGIAKDGSGLENMFLVSLDPRALHSTQKVQRQHPER